MYALYDGVVSFFSDERSGAWGEVKLRPLPLPAARGLPTGFPVVSIEHFQNGDDGDLMKRF